MTKTIQPDIYARVTDRIITALESGVAPWVRPWQSEVDPMPINADSRRTYRGVNFITLQLTAQACGYWRNCWLTYRQAEKHGGRVRKGEHGVPVVFWKLNRVNAKAETEPWPQETRLFENVIPLLRYYTVFNTAQIEGLPAALADPAPSIPQWQGHDVADEVIQLSGARIRHAGGQAFYAPADDYVQLPTMTSFREASDYYATALHELAHWTGHSSRLNRQLGKRFGDEAYAMEELIAELGSAFLCAHCRIEGQLQHASYIEHWLKVLRGDKRAIFVASTKAQNAADFLTAKLAPAESETVLATAA